MDYLHNRKPKFHTHQWITYTFSNLQLGVSEDSGTLSHKNGSLLFLLCLIIGKLYELSKIPMVRAHIDKVKSATFFIRREVEISNIFNPFCLNNYQEKQCV